MAGITPVGIDALANIGLHLPDLVAKIVATPFDKFDFTKLFLKWPASTGNSIIIPLEQSAGSVVANRVGEYQDIPLNVSPMTSTEIPAYKIGEGVPISNEMIEDDQIGWVDHQMMHLVWKLINTRNTDFMDIIDNGVPVANTIAATGVTVGQDLTVGTFVGTVGGNDLITAARLLAENYKGDSQMTLLMNPIGIGQLRRLPIFMSLNQIGRDAYASGVVGEVYGMTVVSSNLVPAMSAYVIATDVNSDKEGAQGGQNTPYGYWFEKRPIVVVVRERKERDGIEFYGTTRYGVGVTYPLGSVKITYTGYS